MIESLLTQANLRTRSLFENYKMIADDTTAFIMACAESGQTELAQPLIERKREDNRILMEETYRCLAPREEVMRDYEQGDSPPHAPPSDDGIEFVIEGEREGEYPPAKDAEQQKNDE